MKMSQHPAWQSLCPATSLNAEVFHHQMEKLIEEEWVEKRQSLSRNS